MLAQDRIIKKYASAANEAELKRFLASQDTTRYVKLYLEDEYFRSEFGKFKALELATISQAPSESKDSFPAMEDSLFRTQTDASLRNTLVEQPTDSKQVVSQAVDNTLPNLQTVYTVIRPAQPIGLINDSATHYFNCLVQAMFFTDPMTDTVLNMKLNRAAEQRQAKGTGTFLGASREFKFTLALQQLYLKLVDPFTKEVSAYYPFHYLGWKTSDPRNAPNSIGFCYEQFIKNVNFVRENVDDIPGRDRISYVPIKETYNFGSNAVIPRATKITISDIGPQMNGDGQTPDVDANISGLKSGQRLAIEADQQNDFLAQFRSIIVGESPQTNLIEREVFYYLSVPSSAKSLQAGLKSYFGVQSGDIQTNGDAQQTNVQKPRFFEAFPNYLFIEIDRSKEQMIMSELEGEVRPKFEFDLRFWIDEFLSKNELDINRIRSENAQRQKQLAVDRASLEKFTSYGEHKMDLFKVIETMKAYCYYCDYGRHKKTFLHSSYFSGRLKSKDFEKALSDLKKKASVLESNIKMTQDAINKAFDSYKRIGYTLYGVVMQTGPVGRSHHYCYIKEKGRWFCFNDTQVKLVSESDVYSDGSGKRYLNSGAVALLYEQAGKSAV